MEREKLGLDATGGGKGCPVPGQRSGQGAEVCGPLPAAPVAVMGGRLGLHLQLLVQDASQLS